MSSAINFSNVGNLAGFIGTDLVSYTPTFTGFGTVSTQTFWWRRDGDSLVLEGTFTAGTPTAVEARLSLPNGLIVDSIKVPSIRTAGWYILSQSGGGSSHGGAIFIESGAAYITFSATGVFGSSSVDAAAKALGNAMLASGNQIQIQGVRIPIAGWAAGGVIGSTSFTAWQVYTPTYTGLGTVTGSNMRWRQTSNDSIEIQGYFTAGTGTGVTATVSLPSSKTTLSSTIMGALTSQVGTGTSSVNQTATYTVLVDPGTQYFSFGYTNNGAAAGGVSRLGNALFANGERVTLTATIPAL